MFPLTNLTPREKVRLLERVREKGRAPQPVQEPIAVVGMACRFPGASSLEEFEANLRRGVCSISEIPADRFAVDEWFDPEPAVCGKTNTRWGGFISRPDEFDASFFGISEDEARAMDPQQRILLETAIEALDHAGYSLPVLRGSFGAVYVGAGSQDYGHQLDVDRHSERIDPYYGTGNSLSFLSARIARYIGIHGPALTVDTACSASLVAIHLACQALRTQECDWALAGGVNLILRPAGFVYVSQIRAVAADGRCKAFSGDADGYVRGEGCGLVVLKRFNDAVKNRDRILAVIRASGVNHDGRSSSLTAPNGRAQLTLLKRAMAQSGLDGAQIGYVEAHGTGTPLGDPIEVRALCEALRGTDSAPPLVLGSVKANIGHLEAAAGVAGLIKAVLMLTGEMIPPHINFRSLSTHLEGLPVRIPLEEEPWGGAERYAGVSSFGIGGTNAHVVLSAAEKPVSASQLSGQEGERDELLVVAGRDQADLEDQCQAMADWLDASGHGSLGSLAYAMGSRRSAAPVRRAVVGRSKAEWREQLKQPRGRSPESASPGWVWVYSGQGGSEAGELSRRWEEMQAERWFREETEAWEKEVERRTGWGIGPSLQGREEGASLWQKQLVRLVWQMGLTAQLRGWGLEAAAVVGHSAGEVAAAVAAGAMGRGEGVEVVWRRGLQLEKLQGQGGMIAVRQESMPEAPEGLSLAALNGPSWKVWSGENGPLRYWHEQWERQGLEVRRIETMGVPGHGPAVEQGARALERELAGEKWNPSLRIRMRSSVTGGWLKAVDAQYWRRNLRETVRFDQAIAGLLEEGFRHFVEVGTQAVLGGAIEEQMEASSRTGEVEWSLRRGEPARRSLLRVAGRAFESGQALRWNNIASGHQVVDLPPFPWRRERYWFSDTAAEFPVMLREEDLTQRMEYSRAVDRVLTHHCPEGARAVNRRHLAPNVFLGCRGAALFFCSQLKTSVVALLYAGDPTDYDRLAVELEQYARRSQADLYLMATAAQADSARGRKYATTPIGVRQFLCPLSEFHLQGASMQRLRYLVEKYRRFGSCAVREANAGDGSDVDALISAWVARKGAEPVFIADARREMKRLSASAAGNRTFLTHRNERLECAILLSPAPQEHGYLMDLEFYGADTPLGCLEYSIVEIVRQLVHEGYEYLGLGGTYGTALETHPNEHGEIAQLLHELHSANILNGDSNLQFKNKFRPTTEPLFLCCPQTQSAASVQDVLSVLSGRSVSECSSGRDFALELLDVPGSVRTFAQTLRSGEWLTAHAVSGHCVVPGSYYIDAAIRATHAAGQSQGQAIQDFVIERPLQPGVSGMAEIRIVVDPGVSVEIYGRDAPSTWVRLAAGRCSPLPQTSSNAFRPADSQSHFSAVDPLEFYRQAEQAQVHYGEFYRVIRKLWISRERGESLAWIETTVNDIQPFFAHPALLDGALQTISAARGYDLLPGGQTTQLQAIESIELHRALPRTFWAAAKLANHNGTGGIVSADVQLWDAEGVSLGCLRGVCARVKQQSQSCALVKEVPLYRIEWFPADTPGHASSSATSQTWVVRASPRIFRQIGAVLESFGHSVVETPEKGKPVSGVIHADALESDYDSAVALIAESLRTTCASLLDWPEHPHLWVLTQGAQAVKHEAPDPRQAALWGYARVFAMEHPNAWGGLVDLDPDDASLDLTAPLAQILSGNSETETAWRQTRSFVPRMMPAPVCESRAVGIRRDGCYLVIGGSRGAGLATAQWLGRQGSSHIVITGRQEQAPVRIETEPAQWGNAAVYKAGADATSEPQMRNLFDWISAAMPPLRGIVFAAATIEDGAVARQPEEAVRRSLRTKIEGSQIVERMTTGIALDFIVFYSSAAVLLAPRGQSAYAAANAFMDALAHRIHQSRNCRVLSVNWGHWLNTGSADSPALAERLRYQGIVPMSAECALEALPRMLARAEPQLIALDIQWDRWQSGLPGCLSKLWARLIAQPEPLDKIAKTSLSANGSRPHIETSVLRRIRITAGNGAPANDVSMTSNLKDLGFDSLALINLRRLIENDLGVRVPIAALFGCVDIRGLCDTIREREPALASVAGEG